MSVNKIKFPDSTTANINDSRIHIYRTLTGTAAVTTSPYYCSRWNVSDSTISAYEDGMVVCIKVPVVGNDTYGVGLQINSLGYKPVVFNVNSNVTTRYGVGAVVWAVYNSAQTASLYVNSSSALTITGCWQVMDYDQGLIAITTGEIDELWTPTNYLKLSGTDFYPSEYSSGTVTEIGSGYNYSDLTNNPPIIYNANGVELTGISSVSIFQPGAQQLLRYVYNNGAYHLLISTLSNPTGYTINNLNALN